MDLYYDEAQQKKRGILTEIHIADLHFGAFDPEAQYNILMEQFITKVEQIPSIDIVSINGETYQSSQHTW